MRVGIDISQIVYEGTGVSRFTKGLIDAILKYETSHEWVFFLSSLRKKPDSKIVEAIKNKGYKLVQYPLPPSALSFFWNDLHTVKVETILGELDWFISSDWTEPPSTGKKATVVHDLTFKRYPETVDSTIQSVQKKRFTWIEKESLLIFADSKSTKDDLVDIMGYTDKNIVVNYPGVVTHKQSYEKVQATKRKYNLQKPFILSVGKLEPRKNIKRLIDAYGQISDDVELAIVGQSGWDHDTKEQNKSNEKVRWLGYIPDEELYALYQASEFFIFPSIWEGFGYPAIEAMQLGCACALSNTSSLAELGTDAAFLFDPWDTVSIKHALETLLTDKTLRSKLTKKGYEKAAAFTWKRYFDTMIESLTK